MPSGTGRVHKAERQTIGMVGVDAGMLYLGDPCYVIDRPLGRKDWNESTLKALAKAIRALKV